MRRLRHDKFLTLAPAGESPAGYTLSMILGLRTVIYHVPDLQRAKAWYSTAFGVQPYFDEPFYVGFNIGGYELGLDPDTKGVPPGAGGAVTYWGVPDIDAAVRDFTRVGAKPQARAPQSSPAPRRVWPRGRLSRRAAVATTYAYVHQS